MSFTEVLLYLGYVLRALHMLWNLIFTSPQYYNNSLFKKNIIKHLLVVSQAWHFVKSRPFYLFPLPRMLFFQIISSLAPSLYSNLGSYMRFLAFSVTPSITTCPLLFLFISLLHDNIINYMQWSPTIFLLPNKPLLCHSLLDIFILGICLR